MGAFVCSGLANPFTNGVYFSYIISDSGVVSLLLEYMLLLCLMRTNVQRVSGISLPTWNANVNVAASFRQAIVSCLNSMISYANVVISTVSDGGTVSAVTDAGVHAQMSIMVSVSSVIVNYHVVQSVPGTTSEEVAAMLTDAINNGYFTAYLQAYGSANGVSSSLSNAYTNAGDFQVVTGDSPTASPTLLQQGSGDGANSLGLTKADIALIVVFTVVGYIAFVLMWRCVRRTMLAQKGKEDPDSAYSPLPINAHNAV